MTAVQTIPVAADDGELRLDRWFRRHFPGLGHGRLEKLLRTGQVRVDGRRAKAGDRIAPGQVIRVPPLGDLAVPPERTAAAPRPADLAMIERAVLHRDDDVIVIDKPPGLAVQGGTNTERHLDAMLDALRFGAKERPRLVHRLDRDTSGVLVLARSAAAAAALARAFRDKATQKVYWAVVVGLPKPRQGRIDQPLAKLPGRAGERVAPDEDEGKRAVTYFRTVSHAGDKLAWLALEPVTGRTHQLRAHCVTLGTPILGDGKYGGAAAHPSGVPNARKLHLHARALALPHPAGGRLVVAAPLPPHLKETFRFFGFDEAEEADPFAGLATRR
ncbi:MAG TPA: RluA family pseudouridine synthase [Stellaceae bacterium]|jgi:23S rRNA pseudouridine955/2504/2580 synthase|nr:RluA family pseudouridine synthase [Stellaceae bacterium]